MGRRPGEALTQPNPTPPLLIHPFLGLRLHPLFRGSTRPFLSAGQQRQLALEKELQRLQAELQLREEREAKLAGLMERKEEAMERLQHQLTEVERARSAQVTRAGRRLVRPVPWVWCIGGA